MGAGGSDRARRVILITGTSSGIGKVCAERLHARGYRVYGTLRGPDSEGPATAGAYRKLRMDVDDDASVVRGVEEVIRKEERLDVVVNNAGFGIAGPVEETSLEEARAQFETNFFGVLRVCRASIPVMREQGSGLIVNVSSMAGRIAIPYQGLYTASKFALEGLSEALSMEVRPFGINVVLIEPGDFKTHFTGNRRRASASGGESAYTGRFEKAVAVMEADERGGGPPDRIAVLLERIIESPSPRLRYPVGPFAERAAMTLKKILPGRLFEKAIMKYYRSR